MYDRQQTLGLTSIETATVIGCGGTGVWTALLLAMSGVPELILVDDDSLEESNLNRLPFSFGEVTISKVTVLKKFIKRIRPLCRIEVHPIKIDINNIEHIVRGVVFCCTDSIKSQQLIAAYCLKNTLSYHRVGYDGNILNVGSSFPLTFKDPEEMDAGYTVVPSWVVPAVMAASMAVYSAMKSSLCIMDDIGKLTTESSSFIPPKILEQISEKSEQDILDNITDYIPDDYGYCPNCSRCDGCEAYDDGLNTGREQGRDDILNHINDYLPSEYSHCPTCRLQIQENLREQQESLVDEENSSRRQENEP